MASSYTQTLSRLFIENPSCTWRQQVAYRRSTKLANFCRGWWPDVVWAEHTCPLPPGCRLLDRVAQDVPDLLAASPDHRSAVSRLLRLLAAPAPILARARYSEDRLLEAIDGGVAQYVTIGAGLETFALRYPDLQDRLQVSEIDRGLTQAFKQQALAQAGLASPPNLHLVAADLEAVSVADALRGSSFKPEVRSVFSLQGITAYLTRQAFRDTLHSIRSVAAPGSFLLLSYLDADAFRAGRASERVRKMIELTRSVGEPSITGFDPPVLQEELRGARFDLIEDLDPEEQQRRYFSGRNDGYQATEHFHLACAGPSDV
jgi:methyltransferase (TIGR00027 family)